MNTLRAVFIIFTLLLIAPSVSVASGGTITYTDSSGLNPRSSPAYVGGYVVETFNSSGSFVINTILSNVEYLVVGGGGGGGGGFGISSGGGAGGLLSGTIVSLPVGVYPITIGSGGVITNNGENSSALGFVTNGGGAGGGSSAALSGGSGGGGGPYVGYSTPGTGIAGQGNSGGTGATGMGVNGCAGGGGAGGAGSNAKWIGGTGIGGLGLASSISGILTYYAGGGGGCSYQGGIGGGGSGATPGVNGTGGGGASLTSGGSGIVIIRYRYSIDLGTINVSSNLSGASWTITGPETITGNGTSQTNSNKPVGTYTIMWGSVPGYTTPATQSFTLTSGNTINFSGSYISTLADLTAGPVTPLTTPDNTPTTFSSAIMNIGGVSTSEFGGSCLQLTISSDTKNYNIRTAADTAGWVAGQPICLTVNPGVTVGSLSTAQPAMTTGIFPVGTSINLINRGSIIGAGGNGGRGTNQGSTFVSPNPATNGENGGNALSLNLDVKLDSTSGTILGGGGGGAGSWAYVGSYGGGGGGGAGSLPGSGGLKGNIAGGDFSNWCVGTNGSAGSTGGGLGGNSAYQYGCPFNAGYTPLYGGTGGSYGQNGANTYAIATNINGYGGLAGTAIVYNGFTTSALVTDFSNFFQVATAPNGGGTVIDLPATTMSPVNAGDTRNATVSHTFMSAGTYSMRACADGTTSLGGGVITESNETNNCGPWTDIVVSPPTPPNPCALTSINDCFLPDTPSGGNAGACISLGTCNYSCTNGAWTQNTNSCVNPPENPILTVNRRTVEKDGTVTLTWDTKNGNEALCTLTAYSGGPNLITADGDSIGSLNATIPARSTYTLSCPNPLGGAPLTDTVSVDIVPVGVET